MRIGRREFHFGLFLAITVYAVLGSVNVLGRPVNTAYYDHLVFAGILDNSDIFAGTIFLETARQTSNNALIIPVLRYLHHLGVSYTTLGDLYVTSLINVPGLIAIACLSLRASGSAVFAVMMMFIVQDLFFFQHQVLASGFAMSTLLLVTAFLVARNYRVVAVLIGISGLIHPAYPPILIALCILAMYAIRDEEPFSANIGTFAAWLIPCILPYAVMVIRGSAVRTPPEVVRSWVDYLRAVNQLPFPAMNAERYFWTLGYCGVTTSHLFLAR